METMYWADRIVADIRKLERALRACKSGQNTQDDPSELRAEIARLQRLLD